MGFDLTHTSNSAAYMPCLQRFSPILRNWVWNLNFGGEKKLHASALHPEWDISIESLFCVK